MKRFNRSVAVVSVSGQLTAKVDDTQTDMRVMGQFEFDRQGKFTRNVRLTIQERRDISQLAPGYEVTTVMQMKVDRKKTTRSITDASLKQDGISKRKWSDSLRLVSESGRFAFRHGRDWRVIVNEPETAILRCVDDGVVLGQCTAISLAALPSAKAYPLKQFVKDVQSDVKAKRDTSIPNSGRPNKDTMSCRLKWLQRSQRQVHLALLSRRPTEWRTRFVRGLLRRNGCRFVRRARKAVDRIVGLLQTFREPQQPFVDNVVSLAR